MKKSLPEKPQQAVIEILKEKILQLMPQAGRMETAITGFNISRRNEPTRPENCFYSPLVAIILQGNKRAVIANEEFHYGPNSCLMVGMHLPSVTHITNASVDEPFITMSLELNRYLIAQLSADLPSAGKAKDTKSVAVFDAQPEMLDAFYRLMRLLDEPGQIPVLAPMIIREIHYRLLISPFGSHLRVVGTIGTQSNQIAQAISWLKENYAKPLHIDELSHKVHMAPSTFHRHFKQITSLSPLQFQKHLRLYEAQRLMLIDEHDASTAALAVGYESPTQFNREYKRLFGEPPRRDINRLAV
jgi:AraC-like DNA-binding protein